MKHRHHEHVIDTDTTTSIIIIIFFKHNHKCRRKCLTPTQTQTYIFFKNINSSYTTTQFTIIFLNEFDERATTLTPALPNDILGFQNPFEILTFCIHHNLREYYIWFYTLLLNLSNYKFVLFTLLSNLSDFFPYFTFKSIIL